MLGTQAEGRTGLGEHDLRQYKHGSLKSQAEGKS